MKSSKRSSPQIFIMFLIFKILAYTKKLVLKKEIYL